MPATRLRAYLDENRVRYLSTTHSQAYTAQEIAAATHVRGKAMAKTVMVKLDGRMAMAVLPASHKVDLDVLRRGSDSRRAELATEAEFKLLFPDCEPGAMPPFGNLYGLPVYIEGSLGENREISFNAGTHTEVIRMAYGDYERLVKPVVLPSLQHA